MLLDKDQGRYLNRPNTHWLFYNGLVLNMKAWADVIGINYNTLSSRINQYGWSIQKALTTKVKTHGNLQ